MQRRWSWFHATDFQSLMYPCFIFYRILGIFPYKFNASIFESSKPYYIMSIIVGCVCFVMDIFLVNIIISTLNVLGYIQIFLSISYLMLSDFIIIITLVLRSPRMCLLQTIMDISSKLSLKSYQKLSRLIYTKDILGIIFQVMQISIFFYKANFQRNCLFILIMIVCIYRSMIIFQSNMLYINCVCVLKACFESINDNLRHMQRPIATNIKSCGPNLICHVQRNQFLLEKLQILEKWHLMVSDTVQRLNTIFSLQLLATMALILSANACTIYIYVVHWQDGIIISLDMDVLGLLIVSITYYIIIIMLLVWVCETGKNQAQEISMNVHELLNSTYDERIKNELQLFSLQILHHENTFTAKGLSVDAKLLVTIVNKVTTYLVILVQFLNASHSCNSKINVT